MPAEKAAEAERAWFPDVVSGRARLRCSGVSAPGKRPRLFDGNPTPFLQVLNCFNGEHELSFYGYLSVNTYTGFSLTDRAFDFSNFTS